MKTLIAIVLAASLALACGKKTDGDKGEGAPAPSGGDEGKPPAPQGGGADAWKDLELPDLGAVANAPGDAKISALGGITAMHGLCNPGIREAGGSVTFENHIQNVEAGNRGGALKEYVTKDKKSDDEWVLSYITEDKWGYFSQVKVGDKVLSCGATSSSGEAHECVTKICGSLRAK